MDSRKLPTFLCIGAPKCGSSWLHALLESHSEVFIPTELKEIHFFDDKFDRGEQWYGRFFEGMTDEHSISGEITPHYLYSDPQRIQQFESIKKLLIIYRNPVDRIISHYKFRIRLDNYTGSLEEFLVDYPQAVEWSSYGKHFENFLRHFDRDQFLVLQFEEATKDVASTRSRLASFLGIDESGFPGNAGEQIVNPAFNPKNKKLYSLAIRAGKWMGDNGLYGVRNWLKNNALTKKLLLTDGGKFKVEIPESVKQRLESELADDMKKFEALINQKKVPAPN